jgi:hypothetical protein
VLERQEALPQLPFRGIPGNFGRQPRVQKSELTADDEFKEMATLKGHDIAVYGTAEVAGTIHCTTATAGVAVDQQKPRYPLLRKGCNFGKRE